MGDQPTAGFTQGPPSEISSGFDDSGIAALFDSFHREDDRCYYMLSKKSLIRQFLNLSDPNHQAQQMKELDEYFDAKGIEKWRSGFNCDSSVVKVSAISSLISESFPMSKSTEKSLSMPEAAIIASGHVVRKSRSRNELVVSKPAKKSKKDPYTFVSYRMGESDVLARQTSNIFQVKRYGTFFDRESMGGGSDLRVDIVRGIICAQIFVFILSNGSMDSNWQEPELRTFQCLKLTDESQLVIPVSNGVSTNKIPEWYEELVGLNVLRVDGMAPGYQTEINQAIARWELSQENPGNI